MGDVDVGGVILLVLGALAFVWIVYITIWQYRKMKQTERSIEGFAQTMGVNVPGNIEGLVQQVTPQIQQAQQMALANHQVVNQLLANPQLFQHMQAMPPPNGQQQYPAPGFSAPQQMQGMHPSVPGFPQGFTASPQMPGMPPPVPGVPQGFPAPPTMPGMTAPTAYNKQVFEVSPDAEERAKNSWAPARN